MIRSMTGGKMNDLQAARYIDQALANLPSDYPANARAMALRAFGRLILGRLGLKPGRSMLVLHKNGRISVRYEDKKEAN